MHHSEFHIPSLSTQEKTVEIQQQTQEYTNKIIEIIFASFRNEDVTQLSQRSNLEWEFVIGENTAYELSCQFSAHSINVHSHRMGTIQYTCLKMDMLDLIKLNEVCAMYKTLGDNILAKKVLDHLSSSTYGRAIKIDELLIDIEKDSL